MTTMTHFSERFTHPKPIKPQVVRDLDAMHRQFDRGMRIKDNLTGLAVATRALLDEMEYKRELTPEEREQVAAYNRQVDVYNAAVAAYNGRVRAWRAERAAAKEAARVQAERCDRCFMIHGKGQTECW